MEKKQLLYFCFQRSSFVERDITILESEFKVSPFSRKASKPADILIYVFLQFFFLVGKIWKADVIVCQFVGHHSVLPVFFGKLFHKPVLLIPGGSDCVSFPSINYGNYRKKILSSTTNWSYHNATHVAPVDESLVFNNYTFTTTDFPTQGIRKYCNGFVTPTTIIHNGFDADFFQAKEGIRNRNSFLTLAGGGDSESVFMNKGLDLMLEIAASFPACSFTIAGVSNLPVERIPDNVQLFPFLAHSAMPQLMSQHEYYLQLSMSEGFPNALCEAMLCGCIPIVSNVASMPMIIGESGFVLEKRDAQLLKGLIEKIHDSEDGQRSTLARKQIRENYPLEKRKMELLELVNRILK